MSFEDKRFCVYLHRRKDTGEVFYVGSGTTLRPYAKSHRNSRWWDIVDSCGYVVEVVKSNISKNEAVCFEDSLIATYRQTIVNRPGPAGVVKEMPFELFNEWFYVDNTSASNLRHRKEIRKGRGHAVIWRRIGDPAGRLSAQGYYLIEFFGRVYSVHRIVYLLTHGSICRNATIDHIDRVRSNNNPNNLRIVTSAENSTNREISPINKTGVSGVTYHKKWNSYTAKISKTVNGVCETQSRSFSCRVFGDQQALELAACWRKQKEHEFGFLNSNWNPHDGESFEDIFQKATSNVVKKVRSAKKGGTGVRGVYYNTSNQTYTGDISFMGLKIRKTFTVKKYGKEQALQLAIEWRKQKEKEYELDPDCTDQTPDSR